MIPAKRRVENPYLTALHAARDDYKSRGLWTGTINAHQGSIALKFSDIECLLLWSPRNVNAVLATLKQGIKSDGRFKNVTRAQLHLDELGPRIVVHATRKGRRSESVLTGNGETPQACMSDILRHLDHWAKACE